jgi:tRNA-specific 2-thiouridylase
VLNEAVRRRALDTARAGRLEDAVAGRAGGTPCGDSVEIDVALAGGRVAAARWRAVACPHATAAAALACELVEGAPFLDAARLGAGDLAARLDADPARHECVALGADALHAALGRLAAGAGLSPHAGRVAVAMSGGVDSAVALLKAVRAGLEPVGVTLALWIDPAARDGERACCSPASVRAARDACHALGVPHVGVDLRDGFRARVVEPFLREYAAGRTPNPCVRCNAAFRFDALAAIADGLGAPRLATGHYARVAWRGGRPLVARAADPAKDQSYMLSGVPADVLRRTWFPLGGQAKAQTRADAAAAGLAAAGRRESQDVCFVGGGDHHEFLERHGAAATPGDVVDTAGRVLARHAGVHRFTPGQRRGIGVAGPRPLYVVATDVASGRVVVGEEAEAKRALVRVRPGRLFVPVQRVEAAVRYRGRPVGATVREGDGELVLELDTPVAGVAPGQTAVLYDDDAVVGAGVIAG